MKKAGLFLLHDGPYLQECGWLKQIIMQAVPDLPVPGTAAAHTPAQLLEALAAQIKQCDLFVIAVAPNRYYDMKAQLLEALRLPGRVNADIAVRQKLHPEDTVFPSGAAVFVAPEARNNGFAMRCGRQHMLMLPLHMGLLGAMRPKIDLYLRRAAGTQVLPISYSNVPISPDLIVPMQKSPRFFPQEKWTERRIEEVTKSLKNSGIVCDLLLPPPWAGAAMLLSRHSGVLHPVLLKSKQLRGNDACSMIKRRMRVSDCKFCGMLTPPAPDGSYALVALMGPGDYARIRRMELHSKGDAAALTLELLTLLSEYREVSRVRTARMAQAAGSLALATA